MVNLDTSPMGKIVDEMKSQYAILAQQSEAQKRNAEETRQDAEVAESNFRQTKDELKRVAAAYKELTGESIIG